MVLADTGPLYAALDPHRTTTTTGLRGTSNNWTPKGSGRR